jgi:HSP20 family protein
MLPIKRKKGKEKTMSATQKKLNEMVSLREAMDSLLKDSFIWPRSWMTRWQTSPEDIPLDIYEEGDNLIVRAAVPGVKPDKLNVEVHDDILSISGEAKEDEERKEGSYYLREHHYGHFERSLTLPCAVKVEKAEAEFEDGILTLTLPKIEKAKGKKIQIKSKGKLEK